jgi:hypothetical protein
MVAVVVPACGATVEDDSPAAAYERESGCHELDEESCCAVAGRCIWVEPATADFQCVDSVVDSCREDPDCADRQCQRIVTALKGSCFVAPVLSDERVIDVCVVP